MGMKRFLTKGPGTSWEALKRGPVPALFAAGFALVLFGATGDRPREIDIRRGGALWAGVDGSGDVRILGVLQGRLEADGQVRLDGVLVGGIEPGGDIRRDGSLIGSLEGDGGLRVDGAIVGRIEADGRIRRDGILWGEASPCCGNAEEKRRVAAVLVFFTGDFAGRRAD